MRSRELASLACLLCAASLSVRAQIIDTEEGEVAGIPVNYTEAQTGSYMLPGPLKCADGTPVENARAWFEKRRPELLQLLESNQYGHPPENLPSLDFEITDQVAD